MFEHKSFAKQELIDPRLICALRFTVNVLIEGKQYIYLCIFNIYFDTFMSFFIFVSAQILFHCLFCVYCCHSLVAVLYLSYLFRCFSGTCSFCVTILVKNVLLIFFCFALN